MSESYKKRLAYNKKWKAQKRRKTKQSTSNRQDSNESSNENDTDTEYYSRQDEQEKTSNDHEENNSSNACASSSRCISSSNDAVQASSHIPSLGDNTLKGNDEGFNDDNNLIDIPTSSSESEEDDSDGKTERLAEFLRDWTNEYELPAYAVDKLLKFLQSNGHSNLPRTARTLLKTPRQVELRQVSMMNYYHFGLQKMLINSLKKYPEESLAGINILSLSFNIDGCPIFKSSNTSAWPVLCVITNITPLQPFPVTLTVGKNKPSNLDFLQDFLSELQSLLANGLDHDDIHFTVKLKCVICDAPARAFVKSTKQYSGYFGCDKCCQRGYYIGRVTYPDYQSLQLRTDYTFRNQQQLEHHKGNSPFLNLPIDMIKDFTIDYMHQVCLGVMRKLLTTWMRGTRGYGRISNAQIAQISGKLLSLKRFIPREFARKPRSLDEVDKWKATEFRQFLLYTGQFALKNVLPDNLYAHFMCLCVAMNILVNTSLTSVHSAYAHNLLKYFVQQCSSLYGAEFLVYNVHSLLHLKDEAVRFNSLDNCAAWVFENYMHQLKRKVRGGNNPAVQIVKRIHESLDVQKFQTTEHRIRCKSPNNFYKTDRGKYCEVVRAINNDENSYLCRVFHTQEPSFVDPCDSYIIGHKQFQQHSYEMKTLPKSTLTTRCMQLQRQQKVVFIPLQHTF